MLNKYRFITILATLVLFGMGERAAEAQISDAQIWDVQVPNDYAGGARGSEGFFFTAEGLYWALPSPKSALVGSEAVQGENAYYSRWTVRNESAITWEGNQQGTDDEEDEDNEDDEDDEDNEDENVFEYNIHDYDYTADEYGPLGSIGYTTQLSDWNTNMLSTHFHIGQRYTFGFMNGHNGWECNVFFIDGTETKSGDSVQVGFNDVNNGLDGYGTGYLRGIFYGVSPNATLPFTDSFYLDEATGNLFVDRMLVEFDSARMWSEISTWGVELNYLRRAHPTALGMFELGLGVRYFKWDEDFGFWGGNNTQLGAGEIYSPSFLDDTSFVTNADNNLVGPQIGLKWSRQTARFSMEILGKFTAAYNAQAVSLDATLASNGAANNIWGTNSIYGVTAGTGDEEDATKYVVFDAPGVREGVSGYDKKRFHEFTPMLEVGVKFNFSLTRAVKLSAGWSGIYAANIARPAAMTDYTLDSASSGVMGVLAEGNRSDVFMHGFTFGIILNR